MAATPSRPDRADRSRQPSLEGDQVSGKSEQFTVEPDAYSAAGARGSLRADSVVIAGIEGLVDGSLRAILRLTAPHQG
ncbi:MAG: hypothetical protein R2704_01800 [Microthrixaceae bacterium]